MATAKQPPTKPGNSAAADKTSAPKAKKAKKPLKYRFVRGVIVFLLLACAGLYVWKYMSDRSWQEKLDEARSEAVTKAREIAKKDQVSMLTLAGVSSRWAAAEVANRNDSAITERLDELIKIPQVARISIAGQDKLIFRSTDAKLVGKPMEGADVTAVTVVPGESETVITVPLDHAAVRVGTLRLIWSHAN